MKLDRKRSLTGYIPSMEDGMNPGVSVKPKTLLMVLDSPNSKKRRSK